MRPWLLSVCLISVVGCSSLDRHADLIPAPDKGAPGPVKLGSNLSAAEFKTALAGKWDSAYMREKWRSIQRARFEADGTAEVVVVHKGKARKYAGGYRLYFERPPDPGSVTLARIVVDSQGSGQLVLSRVWFGWHNGVSQREGLVLRIDREPHGALTRAK